jgi:stage II sporulation protein D
LALALCLGLGWRLGLGLSALVCRPAGLGGRILAAELPQGPNIVRIALDLGQAAVSLTAREGAYSITDLSGGQEIGELAAGQQLSVSPSGSGLRAAAGGNTLTGGARLLLTPRTEGAGLLAYGSRVYRGSLLLENSGGGINVINALDVELYLLGVVPMEMGISTAPSEALKTQAVISRTYALKHKNSAAAYDLTDGGNDQVYGGYSNERPYTTAAVEATAGQAIYYDGQLIEAFFSANAGGYTESAENVWNSALPYAKATPSPEDNTAQRWPQDSSGYPGSSYHWQVRYTIADLETRIARWNRDNPNIPINIGQLRQIRGYAYAYNPATGAITDQPNASGRITRLELVGSGGTQAVHRESVRTLLGLRSSLFTITPEGGVIAYNGVGGAAPMSRSIRDSVALGAAAAQAMPINPGRDSFFVMTAAGLKEMSKDAAGAVTAYTLDGYGYGHGVGLSQWGAIGMAEKGMTYGQIIEHYYNQGKNDGRLAVRAAG